MRKFCFCYIMQCSLSKGIGKKFILDQSEALKQPYSRLQLLPLQRNGRELWKWIFFLHWYNEEHGYSLMDLFISYLVFQLVWVLCLNILDVVTVRMKTIMLVVALMVVTVVDLMSRLLFAQSVNAWEKILQAKLHLDLFVPAQ